MCLPYADCAYLGDDTQCVASGGMQTTTREGMSTFVPYLSTPGADPKKSKGFDDPSFHGDGKDGPCAGDATWVTTPVKQPVGCSARHEVTRCRLFSHVCALINHREHARVRSALSQARLMRFWEAFTSAMCHGVCGGDPKVRAFIASALIERGLRALSARHKSCKRGRMQPMQTKRAAALLGLGMVVLACSSGPGGAARGPDAGASGTTPPIKTADGGLECPKGFRLFNGDCRAVCTATTECGDDTNCIAVDDEDDALCLPYADCAYLGDDTQCVASGGAYVYTSRDRMSTTFVPYRSTPGADPNESTGFDDPYFYGGSPYVAGQAGPCAGDAKWITTPAKPPVGCTARHTVTRCRFFYDRCELATGTTREFVQP